MKGKTLTMKITMMQLHDEMAECLLNLKSAPTPEAREIALENAKIIESVSKQMINNARFILDAEKLEAQIGTLTHSRATDLIG